MVNGVEYTRKVNVHKICYKTSACCTALGDSLIDHGANSSIGGADVHVIKKTQCLVNVEGIDSHQVTDVVIATVGGVVQSQHGPIIAIMPQYAYTGKGSQFTLPFSWNTTRMM